MMIEFIPRFSRFPLEDMDILHVMEKASYHGGEMDSKYLLHSKINFYIWKTSHFLTMVYINVKVCQLKGKLNTLKHLPHSKS